VSSFLTAHQVRLFSAINKVNVKFDSRTKLTIEYFALSTLLLILLVLVLPSGEYIATWRFCQICFIFLLNISADHGLIGPYHDVFDRILRRVTILTTMTQIHSLAMTTTMKTSEYDACVLINKWIVFNSENISEALLCFSLSCPQPFVHKWAFFRWTWVTWFPHRSSFFICSEHVYPLESSQHWPRIWPTFLWTSPLSELCPQKRKPLFDNNFGKCRPIFKMLPPIDY